MFIHSKAKARKSFVIFCLLFLFAILVNSIFVSYGRYVITEGLTSFIISLIPFYYFSSREYDFRILIKTWQELSWIATLFLVIVIILYKYKLVHYGIFAQLTVPTVLIFVWSLYKERENKAKNCLGIAINILITLLLGGRMACAAEVIILIWGFLMFTKMSWTKLLTCGASLLGTWILFSNFAFLLLHLRKYMSVLGLNSRTLYLLSLQLEWDTLFAGVHLSHRDYVYSVACEFIKNNYGLPGGFGVIRHLTDGKFYMAHNLFLEIMIIFGFIGGIILIEAIVYKFFTFHKLYSHSSFSFLLMLGIFYLIYSCTGQSILSSPYALFFLAFLFCGKEKTNKHLL